MNSTNFKATIDYIEAHPEEYDQKFWDKETSCGTTRCFAGTACLLGGIRLTSDQPEQWLGISQDDGNYLFGSYCTWPEILEFYETHKG